MGAIWNDIYLEKVVVSGSFAAAPFPSRMALIAQFLLCPPYPDYYSFKYSQIYMLLANMAISGSQFSHPLGMGCKPDLFGMTY